MVLCLKAWKSRTLPGLFMKNKKIFTSVSSLIKKLRIEKINNKKIVHCHGVFDVVHAGHIDYFKEAKTLGDILVVSVTSDKFVNKGEDRPYYPLKNRIKVLSQISLIDFICVSNNITPIDLLKKIKPHFYFKGKDYKNFNNDITGNILKEKKVVERNGGKLKISSKTLLSSSSYINNKLAKFSKDQKNYILKLKKNIDSKKILTYFEKISKTNILLIGETIIDEYIYSNILGKAGKDPILTINPSNKKSYLGGILSMANILSQFCNKVTVITYLGDKKNQINFIKSKLNKNVLLKYINKKNSPTIKKTRYMDPEGKSKIIGVYDLNDKMIDLSEEKKLAKIIKQQTKNNDNVIVADYGHGLLTKELINVISNFSTRLSINTQLNSANFGFHTISKYKKADIVCVHEGELRQDLRSPNKDINLLANELAKKIKSKKIFITQGAKGALSYDNKDLINCPAFANKVVDKVGAGDTFLSIVSVCSFAGMPNILSLFIGNLFGSIAVSSFGNSAEFKKNIILKTITNLIK